MHSIFIIYLGAVLTVCDSLGVLSQNVESRIVTITQGPVRGYKEVSDDIYAFYGIPYATAPSGINKFKGPLAPRTWTDTYEAVNSSIICPQGTVSDNLVMVEDCLVANIFVPDVVETNLSVVVIVHGGAFQTGWGNQIIPRSLVRTKKIIGVNFNYRLGAHGFLCLGTEDAPGNAGMKDQVALLRWVKDNIASFGGNPDDVTIAGCSAGGGSVDLLTLSKLTNGLFHKAITGSGASIGSVGVQTDPLANAKFYAGVLNFTNVDDVSALDEFYKTASLELLLSRGDVIIQREDAEIIFGPCIERDVGVETFLVDAPLDIIANGDYNKVPLFYGLTNMEGLLFIGNYDIWKHRMNESFSEFLPIDLKFESDDQRQRVANEIKEFYFGDSTEDEDNVLVFVEYFTDTLFAYPMLRTLSKRIEFNEDIIFLYEYSFTDENTIPVPYTNVSGANHCDQQRAVLLDEESITDEFRQMKAMLVELWLNFIFTGNPISAGSPVWSWPRAGAERGPHLSLGRVVELGGVLLAERAALWDRVYAQHYRAPIAPHHLHPPAPSSARTLAAFNFWIVSVLCIMWIFIGT